MQEKSGRIAEVVFFAWLSATFPLLGDQGANPEVGQ
jgi:hypothetical protein